MTADQVTELLIALNHIAGHLSDIADSNRSIAADTLSPREAYSAAAMTGLLADCDDINEKKLAELAGKIADAMVDSSEAIGV